MGEIGDLQLPLDILPHILEQLEWRTRDLHACCSVSKTWNRYATPKLYSRLFLRDQTRLIKVFRTLEEHDHLARLVKVLEIRVYPFGLKAEDLERLEASLLASLLKATNLQGLYWTRTGSLTDRIIPFLPTLPSLETLELTGSSRFYSPSKITKHLVDSTKTPNLKHFSILLPDRQVCDELPRWAMAMGSKLESFSVLCQHSTIVTDSILKEMSKYLTCISRLSIAGAKQVTVDGVLALVKTGSIRELALEGLAVHPSTFPRLSPSLFALQSLTLTYPKHSLCSPQEFWQHLGTFMEDLPNVVDLTLYRSSWNTSQVGEADMLDVDDLEDVDDAHDSVEQNPQVYRRQEMEEHASSGQPIIREPRLSSSFLRRLLHARGSQLCKLRIHGIVTSSDQVKLICEACPGLQDVVLHLFEDDNPLLESCLEKLPNLVSLHILSPLYSSMFVDEAGLKRMARRSSTTLRQIGFRNRVWLVDRQPIHNVSNEEVSEDLLQDGRRIVLKRWDMSAGVFPEVLLVVRA